MEEYVLEYLTYLNDKKGIAENTASAYEQDLFHFLRFLYKNHIEKLSKISDTICASYLLYLESDGRKPSSIARKLAALHGFFDFCIRKGYVESDPTDKLKAAKGSKKEIVILSVEQIQKLLSLPDETKKKGIRDKALLEILYATGMKASELSGIHWYDVNLKLGYICISDQKKERIVPIHKRCMNALQQYKNSLSEGEGYLEGLLFPAREGSEFSRQGIWKIVRAYGKKMEMNDLNPQMIRDSFISHMLANGADMYVMQQLLGVSDLSFALGHLKNYRPVIREVYQKAHPSNRFDS